MSTPIHTPDQLNSDQDNAQHPSNDLLQAYNLGQLTAAEAVAIESHISECEPCCDTIISLSSEDTFIDCLRDAQLPSPDQTTDHSSEATRANGAAETIPPELANHDRYEVTRLIGRGGMGVVYRARHRRMDRTVAVKVLHGGLIRKPEAVDRFHREVKAAAKLAHRHIVTAHDADQAGDFHFMVMEFVDGTDLAQLVRQRGPLPVDEACHYVQQVALGLQHANERGMVHRDIKPHNLMVTPDGTVKILDFGLASLAPMSIADEDTVESRSDLTIAGSVLGTPDFISPEQSLDARDADIRSDLYSLGATFYFLLSGKPPFPDGNVAEKLAQHASGRPAPLQPVRPDVPVELVNVINKLLDKDPQRRYQSPRELADALSPLISITHSGPETSVAASIPSGKRSISRSVFLGWMSFLATSFALIVFALLPRGDEKLLLGLASLATPEQGALPLHLASPSEVPSAWYSISGSALNGKHAAVWDLGKSRIVLLGQETKATSESVGSLYLRIAGPSDKRQLSYTDEAFENDGKPYFENEYADGVARCRFYNFHFQLTKQRLTYGNQEYEWNVPGKPGVLILINTETGQVTTCEMKQRSKRGPVNGVIPLATRKNPNIVQSSNTKKEVPKKPAAAPEQPLPTSQIGAVSQAIHQHYVDKYALYAAFVNQHNMTRMLDRENRRQISQLAINSPVSKVINSFPGKPLYTFSEATKTGADEVTITSIDLYQQRDGSCRLAYRQMTRKKNPNEPVAVSQPLSKSQAEKIAQQAISDFKKTRTPQ